MKHHRGILRLRCSVCGWKKASKFPRTFQIDVWPYHRGHREHKLSGLAAGDVNAGGQAQSGVKQKSAVWGDLWDNGTAFSQIKHEVYLETLNCTLLPFEGVSQYTEKEEKSDLMLLSCFDCARDNQRKIEGNCPFVLMPTVRIDKELVDGKGSYRVCLSKCSNEDFVCLWLIMIMAQNATLATECLLAQVTNGITTK